MGKSALQKIAKAMRSETGGQTVKSTVGVLFFLAFVASGVFMNSSSLPLSYNIAFGDSGNGSGSGGGGGGGGIFSPRTKARIDDVRVILHLGGKDADNTGKGVATNDAQIGSREWAMPEQGLRRDNERAVAELPFGELSNYLRITKIGLDIPKDARITGITVEIKRSADGPNAIRDYSVRLVRKGKPVGKEYADKAAWPSSDTISTYGGEKDMWGLELSPQEAMSPDFGIQITATNGVDRAVPMTTLVPVATQMIPAQTAPMVQPATQESNADVIGQVVSIKAPLMEGDANEDVRTLQNLLIRWNIGPMARELANGGATGTYGKTTVNAVVELQASVMRNRTWPAAKRLIEAFAKRGYARGSFGLATQGAEIEYLQNTIAGGR